MERGSRLARTALAFVLMPGALASADVIRDGRIGSAGAGPVATENDGLRHVIRESDGARSGNNLFHSFSDFDLDEDESAVYRGSAGIRNLVTTVTGGPSTIRGAIQSEIEGANLFFINPAGVVFGEDATVDVSGAFTVSTADRLHFANGNVLDTGAAGPPGILSVADPSGFGFLDAPAAIRVDGSRLRVGVERSISFIGGDIELIGSRDDGRPGLIAAPSGRIDLVSLAGAGRVSLLSDRVAIAGRPRLGDVTIADEMIVSSSWIESDITSDFQLGVIPARGSGPIFIRADDLTIRDAELRSLTGTQQDASDVSIDLTGTLLIEGVASASQSGIFADSGFKDLPGPGETIVGFDIDALPGVGEIWGVRCATGLCGALYLAEGAAGNVRIRARDVALRNGGKITATSEYAGDAGVLDIRFIDELSIVGRRGPGDVSLMTTNANGTGDPGTIRIGSDAGLLRMADFGGLVIQNSASSNVASAAGLIEIDVAEIAMTGNARIDSSVRGFGPGGLLDLRASRRITMSGRSDDIFFTGISTLAQPGSLGPPGEIRITTPELVMTDGAEISASSVDLTSFPTGGNLHFDIRDRLLMRDATISTESPFSGGNIFLSVGSVMSLVRSSITTTALTFFRDGGDITLRPGPAALVLDDSRIIARSNLGTGGRIDIEFGVLISSGDSTIDANSGGIDGEVLINGVEGNIVPEVSQLDPPAVDASGLVREPCAARLPGASNRFVIDGRRMLPVAADDVLDVPLAEMLREGGSDRASLGAALPPADVAALAADQPLALAARTPTSDCLF